MDKTLSLAAMVALFLSLYATSTAHASKPLCEFLMNTTPQLLEAPYVTRLTGSQFQVESVKVELQENLLTPALQAFFPNPSPDLIKQSLTMKSSLDLTNANNPALIEVFAGGQRITRIDFKRYHVFAWSKDEDATDDPTFPEGLAIGFAQENNHHGTARRFVSVKDKKKSVNFTIGIDVRCEVVGEYTADYASIRQVKTNAMGFPGVACRIPILKAKIKKPEVIFPGSPNWPVTG